MRKLLCSSVSALLLLFASSCGKKEDLRPESLVPPRSDFLCRIMLPKITASDRKDLPFLRDLPEELNTDIIIYRISRDRSLGILLGGDGTFNAADWEKKILSRTASGKTFRIRKEGNDLQLFFRDTGSFFGTVRVERKDILHIFLLNAETQIRKPDTEKKGMIWKFRKDAPLQIYAGISALCGFPVPLIPIRADIVFLPGKDGTLSPEGSLLFFNETISSAAERELQSILEGRNLSLHRKGSQLIFSSRK